MLDLWRWLGLAPDGSILRQAWEPPQLRGRRPPRRTPKPPPEVDDEPPPYWGGPWCD